MAFIFGLAQMKANCQQPIHNLFMQPAHQKKALWMLMLMPDKEIGSSSSIVQDRRFRGDEKTSSFFTDWQK